MNIHMREFEELMRTPVAEKALDDGALLIALPIIKIFTSPELIASLKDDF